MLAKMVYKTAINHLKTNSMYKEVMGKEVSRNTGRLHKFQVKIAPQIHWTSLSSSKQTREI